LKPKLKPTLEKHKKKIAEDYDTIFSNILTSKIPQGVENKSDLREIKDLNIKNDKPPTTPEVVIFSNTVKKNLSLMNERNERRNKFEKVEKIEKIEKVDKVEKIEKIGKILKMFKKFS
jgi:thymidylate kinase